MKAHASMDTREKLSEVALGISPADLVIANGNVFNSFTGEFVPDQSIWIKDNMIAYVGPDQSPAKGPGTRTIDADGMAVLPGLVESHTHVLSSRYGLEEFVRHTIPCGVTTVITEASEFYVIVGKDGLDHVLKGFEKQPIRMYCTFPPLCGLTASEEINALTGADIHPWLENPLCLGVGEIYWSNLLLDGPQGERLKELAEMAQEKGKVVEGHTAGASGRKLQAYTCLGMSSCHEPTTEEEVLERLRLGYWVLIREGYVRKELPGVKGIFKRDIDFRRLALATDGVDPEGFLNGGYLDAALRTAMQLDAPPKLAYQMVTINPAEHFKIDHLIGSLSPGKMADIVITPSPEEFSPRLVMCDGKIIFRDGKTLVEPAEVVFPESIFHSVHLPEYALPLLPSKGKVRAIEMVTRLVTREIVVDLDGRNHSLNSIYAVDRVGSGGGFMGYLNGFGLRQGAYGTTMCWDTPDMIVVGCDHESMRTAIERLREIGGGGVYAIGGDVVCEFPAPICGIISSKPMKEVRDRTRKLDEVLRKNGVPWETPILTVDTFGTAAIPHLRINHRGYVNVKDRKVLPVEI
jgi:adenine deaminase